MARSEASAQLDRVPAGVRPSDVLRLVTLNVYSPANPEWDRRLPVLRSTLRGLDADVVALQEVPVDDGGALVEELLGPGYHLAPFSRPSADGVAGTLATRWPHRRVTELDLRLTERTRELLPWSATLVVEVDTPLGLVAVAHHKPTWPFPAELEREAQSVLAARALEEYAVERDAHLVLLGDLDATPDSASVSFWRGRRSLDGTSVSYQDAWERTHPDDPGHTFDLANPLVRTGEMGAAGSRRIDYVLIRCGDHGPTLDVRECRRVLDEPVDGVWGSDHYGVLADLALPDS